MKFIDNLKSGYTSLVKFASSFQSLILLAIRLFWGFLFLKSGLQKLGNISAIADSFSSLGIPFAEFNAHLVAWTEAIGGGLLIIGFASRLISIPLMIAMTVAFLTAHFTALRNVVDNPSGILKESPFTFLFTAILIFVFGPGKVSLDYFFEKLTKSKLD